MPITRRGFIGAAGLWLNAPGLRAAEFPVAPPNDKVYGNHRFGGL